MGNREREELIIRYIQSNPGCKVVDVLNGTEKYMAKQTFYGKLHDLRNREIIRQEKRNKRDLALYLNQADPLVVVSRNLGRFERTYFELLKELVRAFRDPEADLKAQILEEKTLKVIILNPRADILEFAVFILQHRIVQWLLEIPQSFHRR